MDINHLNPVVQCEILKISLEIAMNRLNIMSEEERLINNNDEWIEQTIHKSAFSLLKLYEQDEVREKKLLDEKYQEHFKTYQRNHG